MVRCEANSLIERNGGGIVGKDVEDDFVAIVVSAPLLGVSHQDPADSASFRLFGHNKDLNVGPGMIGEVVEVRLDDEKAKRVSRVFANCHKRLGARISREIARGQRSKVGLHAFRIAR